MSGNFTKMLGLGIFKGSPLFDEAPRKLRVGVWNLIEDLVEHRIPNRALPYYSDLYNKITAALHLERAEDSNEKIFIKDLVLGGLEWNELFDLIQFLFTEVFYYEPDEYGPDWHNIPSKFSDARYTFTVKINEIFANNNVGWKLKNGIFERAINDVIESGVIIKARTLLGQPLFAGPNAQFNKALSFISKRPEPDKENCVKEAVGALEGLSRILLGNEKITLGKATDIFVGKSIIRKPFDSTFHALFGFVSNEPGSRHGAHALSSMDLFETEYVLYTAAACMLFLARKCGVKPSVIERTIQRPVREAPVKSDFPEEPNEDYPEDKSEEDPKFPSDNEVPF